MDLCDTVSGLKSSLIATINEHILCFDIPYVYSLILAQR